MEINISDYLTDEEIKDILKENIGECIRKKYSNEGQQERLISNLCYEFVFEMINNSIDGDIKSILKGRIIELINSESAIRYELFKSDDLWGNTDSKARKIINETLEEKKAELEGRKYWKEKAEKLQKENIELRNRLDAYELALNIWSRGQSELLMGKNYEPGFKNGMPTYDGSELNFI